MTRRPNIIVLVWDTVRFDRLSVYGHDTETTPFLKSVAADFWHFPHTLAQGCWTLPSHASLFTGMYAHQHQVGFGGPARFPESGILLAELLRAGGYATAAFTQNPWIGPKSGLDRGFDSYFGWELFRNQPLHERSRLTRAMAKALRLTGRVPAEWGYRSASDAMSDAIGRWLTRDWDEQQPFFLFANYMDAHVPVMPPPALRHSRGIPTTVRGLTSEMVVEAMAFPERVSADQREQWLQLYDLAIRHLDHQLSRLFALLRRRHILDNSIVILLSDHGDNYGEHDLYGHRASVYDTLVHVPLLVRLPRAERGGRRESTPTEVADLFSTMLLWAGITREHPGRRTTLYETRSVARSESTPGTRTLQKLRAVNPAYAARRLAHARLAVRTATHKYIRVDGGADELYDLVQDPLETSNAVGQGLPVEAQLVRETADWLASAEAQPVYAPATDAVSDVVTDAALATRLQELGYLD